MCTIYVEPVRQGVKFFKELAFHFKVLGSFRSEPAARENYLSHASWSEVTSSFSVPSLRNSQQKSREHFWDGALDDTVPNLSMQSNMMIMSISWLSDFNWIYSEHLNFFALTRTRKANFAKMRLDNTCPSDPHWISILQLYNLAFFVHSPCIFRLLQLATPCTAVLFVCRLLTVMVILVTFYRGFYPGRELRLIHVTLLFFLEFYTPQKWRHYPQPANKLSTIWLCVPFLSARNFKSWISYFNL